MPTIYILKLSGGHYYVGKTEDLVSRIKAHTERRACAWTTLHPMLEVENILEDVSDFEEDKQVKEYMACHGIQKVRGGSYSRLKLSNSEIMILEKEIRGAKNLCSICGSAGHYAKDCDHSEEESEDDLEEDACFRCGRQGHWAHQCYARRDIGGNYIDSDSD